MAISVPRWARRLTTEFDAVRVRRIVTGALGVALVVQTVVVVRNVLEPMRPETLTSLDSPARGRRADPVSANRLAQNIEAAHLFGVAPASQQDSPAVPFALKLVGTVAGADPQEGFAIIRLANNKDGTFAAGGRVDDSASLLRVYADRVVVTWHGSERVLSFPGREGALQLLANNAGVQMSEADTPEAAPDSGPYVPPQNFPAILANIDYTPRIVGNGIDGVAISGVKDEEKLAQVGLQLGDIVTSMNGVPIKNAGQINDLMKALSREQTVTATIIRDGQSTSAVLTGE